jgi:hypothetical protein
MKTESSYYTEFGVLEFTTEELLKLPEIEQRFLLTASLITNDVRFHWSLMVRAKTDGISDEVKIMQLVRDFWSLRKLSSVIYEADIALNGLIKKSELLTDIVKIEFTNNDLEQLEIKLPLDSSYMNLAGQLRNRSAYHYGVGDLADNIKGFEAEAKHTYFAHQQHGNSISALCEQIITLPTINKAFEGANLEDFHTWCMKSSNLILHFCNLSIAKICTERMPDKYIQMKRIILGDEAALQDHRWPLCLVAETTAVKL